MLHQGGDSREDQRSKLILRAAERSTSGMLGAFLLTAFTKDELSLELVAGKAGRESRGVERLSYKKRTKNYFT